MRHRDIVAERLAAEVGTLRKDAPEAVALAYPSPYAVGMSSLGFQTIYREIHASFRHGDAYACWLPTYPSGCWTLAYASPDRRHDDFLDEHRAFEIETRCRYYNRALQQGAFALPTFARDAVYGGIDPFERFTTAQRGLAARSDGPEA